MITYSQTRYILDFEVQTGIVRNYISDHFGIFCVIRTTLERKNKECIVWRNITGSTVEKCKELMSTIAWILIIHTLNLNNTYIFIDNFKNIFDEMFSSMKSHHENEKPRLALVTTWIKKSLRKKQLLYETKSFYYNKNYKTETYKQYNIYLEN